MAVPDVSPEPLMERPAPTRLKTCDICQHDALSAIEGMLAQAEPPEAIALAHGTRVSQILYHQQHRAAEHQARARFEAEQQQVPSYDPSDPTRRLYPVHREIGSLVEEALRVQQTALKAAGLAPALFALRDLATLVLTLAERVEER